MKKTFKGRRFNITLLPFSVEWGATGALTFKSRCCHRQLHGSVCSANVSFDFLGELSRRTALLDSVTFGNKDGFPW